MRLHLLRLGCLPPVSSAGRSWSTAIPGSSRPSRNSSEAPPPVLMWVIFVASPCCSSAADRVAATDDDRDALVGPAGQVSRDRPSCRGRTTGSRTRRAARSRTRSSPARAPPRSRSGVCSPMSTMCHEAGNFSVPTGLVLGPAGDLLGDHDVGREDDRHVACLRGREDPAGVLDAVVLGEALADRLALGQQERVRHPATDDEDVDLVDQVTRGPRSCPTPSPRRGSRRTAALGFSSRFDRTLDLALHQQPGVGRQELRRRRRSRRGPDGPSRTRRSRRRRRSSASAAANSGSFFSSSAWKRRFSSSSASPVPEPLDRVLGADAERVAGHRDVAAAAAPRGPGRPAAAGARPGPCRRAGRGGSARMTFAPCWSRCVDRRDRRPDRGSRR